MTAAGALLVLLAIAAAMLAAASLEDEDPRARATEPDAGKAAGARAAASAAGPPAVLAFAPPPAAGQRFALIPRAPLSKVCAALESRLAARAGAQVGLARVGARDCMFELQLASTGGPHPGLAGSLFLHLRGDEADVLRHLRIKVNVEEANAGGRVFAAFTSVLDELAALAGFAVDDDLAAQLAARQSFENESEEGEVSFLPERFGGERYNLIVKFTAPSAILPADRFHAGVVGRLDR